MPPARRKPKPKAEDVDSPGLSLTLDGKTYVVRESDLTGLDVRALRRETGYSWVGLSKEIARDPDVDLFAALIWLGRRLAGDEVAYETVLDEMSYGSDLKVEVEDKRKTPAAAEGDDSPEA